MLGLLENEKIPYLKNITVKVTRSGYRYGRKPTAGSGAFKNEGRPRKAKNYVFMILCRETKVNTKISRTK